MDDPSRPPELPDDVTFSMLDPEVRGELRGLPKNLAEVIGRHLVAAGLLVDSEPELALRHARYARAKASRVGLVREAVGLTAYHAGEWAEALSELRAARRMSNGPGHIAVMADCERALGRPERALELAREGQGQRLSAAESIELRIVSAGARRDMGQLDAAVIALQGPELNPRRNDPWSTRLFYAYADNLDAAGRTDEAIRWFLNAAEVDDDGETDAAERAVELSNGGTPLPATDLPPSDAAATDPANTDAADTEDADAAVALSAGQAHGEPPSAMPADAAQVGDAAQVTDLGAAGVADVGEPAHVGDPGGADEGEAAEVAEAAHSSDVAEEPDAGGADDAGTGDAGAGDAGTVAGTGISVAAASGPGDSAVGDR